MVRPRHITRRSVLALSTAWLAISLALAVRHDEFYKSYAIMADPGVDDLSSYNIARSELEQVSNVALGWWLSGGVAFVVAGVFVIILIPRSFGGARLIETVAGLLVVCAGFSCIRLQSFYPRIGMGPEERQLHQDYESRAEERAWAFLFSAPLALALALAVVHWRRWFGTRSSITEQRGFDVIPK